jgi:hypothetical protein
MSRLTLLAQIDPQKALHDYWRESNPEAHITIGSTGFGAWCAGVNWAAVLAFLGVAIPIVFGVVMQCYKQYRLNVIAIKEAQIDSDDRIATRRRDAAARPILPSTLEARVLVPDARPSG